MHPRIYIAAPLFNSEQIATIVRIEQLCEASGFQPFSPRVESEPYMPKPSERKNPAAWKPVFQMNLDGINSCALLLAVLDYPLPENRRVAVVAAEPTATLNLNAPKVYEVFNTMELPDTGVVYEMGYARGSGGLIVGFHPTKPANHLNVMLTHGCDGLVSGWENLCKFLISPGELRPMGLYPPALIERVSHGALNASTYRSARLFDWTVCEQWAAQQEAS